MKKILLAFILHLTQSFAFAQTDSDTSAHMSFKGVPIDGTLSQYVAKMKSNGFVHLGTEDGIAVMKGDFALYKNCIVGVSTLKQMDLVSSITVLFPDRENWSSLSSNYFNLKDLLIQKYGEPTESIEEFQSYTPNDDGSKMTQVQLGACNYYSNFKTEKGTIELSIRQSDLTSCFVKLAYLDKINNKIIKEHALDDL